MSNMNHTPRYTPEPWTAAKMPSVFSGSWVALGTQDWYRAEACVNALAGIPDPAAYVAERDRLRSALERIEYIARFPQDDSYKVYDIGITASAALAGEGIAT